MLQKTLNYFPTSTYDLKPKVKLGPTDSFYPAPPRSDVIATATNPRQIGLTDRDLGLTRWDCNLSVYVHYQNRSHRVLVIGTTEITMQTLWLTYYQNRSYRVCVIGQTEFA